MKYLNKASLMLSLCYATLCMYLTVWQANKFIQFVCTRIGLVKSE